MCVFLRDCPSLFSTDRTSVGEEDDVGAVEDLHLQHVAEQQQEYGGPEYDIDWEEVKRGEASGMPGKWVRKYVIKFVLHAFSIVFCNLLCKRVSLVRLNRTRLD